VALLKVKWEEWGFDVISRFLDRNGRPKRPELNCSTLLIVVVVAAVMMMIIIIV
jgi:hypothetical protein